MSQPYLAQSTRRNSNSIFCKELEVVEDCEPEREARSSLRVQAAWEVRDSLSDSIIELTDEEDDVGRTPLPSAALVSSVHAAKSALLAVRNSSVFFFKKLSNIQG